jgi:hypothetical protein
MMTEVFINIVSGEGGPTLRSIYENYVSKNNLFAMFVRLNLSMIVARIPARSEWGSGCSRWGSGCSRWGSGWGSGCSGWGSGWVPGVPGGVPAFTDTILICS